MKPLMLIPPAQAEALYDAQEEAQIGDRFAPLPWLDDDIPEDESLSRTSAGMSEPQENHRRLRMRAA